MVSPKRNTVSVDETDKDLDFQVTRMTGDLVFKGTLGGTFKNNTFVSHGSNKAGLNLTKKLDMTTTLAEREDEELTDEDQVRDTS